MDWIKQNTFLSGFIAVMAVGVIALGILLFSALGKFKSAMEEYEQTSTKVSRLKGKELYPNEKNLEALKEVAGTYRQSVDALQESLIALQQPLPVTMSDREFQDKLTKEVLELKTAAVRQSIKIPDDFSFGMSAYTTKLPRKEAVADLAFHLDAIDYAVSRLVEDGVIEIASIERPELAVESEAPAEEPASSSSRGGRDDRKKQIPGEDEDTGVVTRYPFKLSFTTTPEAAEKWLVDLGNTEAGTFFYTVRYVTIDNETAEGPPKGIPFETQVLEQDGGAGADADDAGVAETDSGDGDLNLTTADLSDVARIDQRIVMGNENVKVTAAIEALRFAEGAPAGGTDTAAAGN